MIIENKNTNGLAPCLIVPIAAKSIESIIRYVGNIDEKSIKDKWCYVNFSPLAQPNNLDVWKNKRSHLICQKRQCWVNVDYTAYRKRYQQCYPELNIKNMVIDHLMNRRFAKALGFSYIRLMHLDRGVNSSSGRGAEYDVINYKNPKGLGHFSYSKNEISYADPTDLLKILNIKVGAFPLNNVAQNLYLFYG